MLQRSSILVPGDTVWRQCQARRVAILNDAAAYFAALRQTLLRAERTVQIIGWDIHSETCLIGASGHADDGFPLKLGPFLQALIQAKPDLKIDILVWKFAAVYAAEREWNSAAKFVSGGMERIRFCMDSSLPYGSAQHQKIVVVDDVIAFAGGLDLTIRRWDTSEHRAEHPFRKDPDGKAYPPFHDVQCMVDGDVARALGELVRRRWTAAGCEAQPLAPAATELWPQSVPVDAEHITVGVARTEVGGTGRPVREVARLFERSISTAKRFIYIENQFTSAGEVAEALARRMVENRSLRVLIIAPKGHSSWLESQAMQGGRGTFVSAFVDAGVADRLRVLYPAVNDEGSSAAVMVHSKLMIVDDDFLRIGSANLNNRSMGVDSECDLAFEATGERQRAFIRKTRRDLIGHFCGVTQEELPEDGEALFALLDGSVAAQRRITLAPINAEAASLQTMSEILQPIADPKEPLHLERTARRVWTPTTLLAIAGIAASLAGLALAWRYTALRSYADIGFLSGILAGYANSAWAPLYAVAAFILGSLVVFPVVILIAATSAALGPWIGSLSAAAGVLMSSLLLFMIGRVLGQQRLQSLLGARARRIQSRILGRGVIAVAMIRMVPLAPFSIVNILAGASKLSLGEFLAGTSLGMAPGIFTMAALGSQIADFARNASWRNGLVLGLIILVWIAVSLGVQFLVTWLAGRRR